VPAVTAQEWGLADAVVPRTQVDAGLRDFIGPMLAQSVPVLRAFKAQAIAARRGRPMDERRALEQRHIVASWTHPDHWAAVERILGGGDERT
jgi:enoyl-CoA hydratase/carnithine racemase